MCVNNWPRVVCEAERPRLESLTYWLWVKRPNHYDTKSKILLRCSNGSTYSCHSECRAADMQVAGGCNCTMQVGWKPGASFESRPPERSSSAEWPRQTNVSPSPTMLTVATLMFGSRSSRSNWCTIIWPAEPATIRVSETTQRQTFWIASRGSSVNGSYLPTYTNMTTAIKHTSPNQFVGHFPRMTGWVLCRKQQWMNEDSCKWPWVP